MTENCSIVIPVFNEEEILEKRIHLLVEDLKKHFKNFEIVLTENGSVDNTKVIIRKLPKSMIWLLQKLMMKKQTMVRL